MLIGMGYYESYTLRIMWGYNMDIFELRSENLTSLGGPMGSEDVHDNWSRLYSSMDKAMKAAERDYKKEGGEEKIIWKGGKSNKSSQDLRWVMYHITKQRIQ